MQSERPDLTPTQTAALDRLLDRIYSYHGETKAPKAVDRDTWAAPARLPHGTSAEGYFLHYFQSQGLGPTANECVTTSTVMAMNMIEDRLRAGPQAPLQFAAELRLEEFIRGLESLGLPGWRFRFPTRSPLPGMMPPSGARRAMRLHAARMQGTFGRSYHAQTRSGMTPEDLLREILAGRITLLHGAWQKRLSDPRDKHLALLGGMPHTMLLVGYEPHVDHWDLLNPAEPWLTSRDTSYHPHIFRMTTPQLMDFWGRRFLFYPPRFAVTILTED